MTASTTAPEQQNELPALRSHVCWVVDDDAECSNVTEALLRSAAEANQKPALFGPADISNTEALLALAPFAVDPYVAVLERRPFGSDGLFAAFRNESARARDEGYAGLYVMADMDWLPRGASGRAVESFELLLDREARALDATIVCAYRRSSFDEATIRAATCVHPVVSGAAEPPFQMVAGDGCWELSGEIDVAVEEEFAVALEAAATVGECVFDVARLQFIDVRGMSLLGKLATAKIVELRGATPALRRHLQLACPAAHLTLS